MNDWTLEDVERLASEVMGWTEVDPSRPGGPWKVPTGGGGWRPTWLPRDWNPFTDANADYEVLERIRATWMVQWEAAPLNRQHPWRRLARALKPAHRYEIGDYSRGALAVLKGEQR